MNDVKKFYCRHCDTEITDLQKKNYRGLCPECASLVETKKTFKSYLVIGIIIVPLLTVVMWFMLNFAVMGVEFITNGDFFSEWVNFYRTYDFLKDPFDFLYHPIFFSPILSIITFIVVTRGIRSVKKPAYYIMFLVGLIITLMIYVFLVISLFS